MINNVIIFGISGQDGFYLKRLCEGNGYKVIGVSRSTGDWIQGSVSDKAFVVQLIKQHQPYCVFHLAANSSTRHDLIFENNETICTGSINILEAVYTVSNHSKIFLSGSGLQFANKGVPIIETDDFFAGSPYAAQRIYTTYLARYYRTLGVQVYVGYFFHHDSPLRSDRHLNIKIVNAALQIKAGSNEVIEIGNPDVIKEFNHAQDMMQAVWLLVSQEMIHEAVIGSGKGYTIWDWINLCAEITGADLKKHVRINNEFKAEFEQLVSDPFALVQLGWKPTYTIRELAESIINEKSKNSA